MTSSRRVLKSLLAFTILAIASCSSAQAKVTLAKIFTDGAILQKGKPIHVFGSALPGEVVTVQLGSGVAGQQVVGKNGRFDVTLPAMTESGPLELRVSGQNTLLLANIRLGQVWLVAGEGLVHGSMEEELSLDKKWDQPTTESTMPANMMIFKQEVAIKRSPDRIGSGNPKWIKASDKAVANYSALAQIFGKTLAENIKEPIGIIQVSCPDTPLRAWLSEAGLASKGDGRTIQSKFMLDEDNYNKLWLDYQKNKSAGMAPELAGLSSGVYNGMLASLVPYALKGIVFCQGESDIKAPLDYKLLLPIFITDIRSRFNQASLPFVYLQLGAQPSQTIDKDNNSEAASIRLTQLKARVAPRSYMTVSCDLCQEDVKKGTIYVSAEDLAKRLAGVALGAVYSQPKPYLTPVVEYTEVEGETIKAVFKNAPSGLICRDKKLKGFAIAGYDHKFFDANASLEDLTVYLQSKFVKSPKYIRYAWGNNPRLSLFSEEGMPASPYADDR